MNFQNTKNFGSTKRIKECAAGDIICASNFDQHNSLESLAVEREREKGRQGSLQQFMRQARQNMPSQLGPGEAQSIQLSQTRSKIKLGPEAEWNTMTWKRNEIRKWGKYGETLVESAQKVTPSWKTSVELGKVAPSKPRLSKHHFICLRKKYSLKSDGLGRVTGGAGWWGEHHVTPP